MRAKDFISEDNLGTTPKRLPREGSRPARGHKVETRYKTKEDAACVGTITAQNSTVDVNKYTPQKNLDAFNLEEQFCEECGGTIYGSVEEAKATRALCTSSKPDSDLGASMLASCKSQGLRARDGNKSHKLGKGPESRVKVGGHKLKGKKYGGKLPDWGTHK